MHYKALAIANASDLIFGECPHPIETRKGMVIGGGTVYPELNFTLPDIHIDRESMLDEIPADEDEFIAEMMEEVELDKFSPAEYDLPG